GVAFVNTSLQQIEELNTRISGIDRTTEQAAAIRDERQRLIDGISEYMPVRTVTRNAGKVDLFTPQGVALLAGSAREIEFSPANTFGPEHTLASGTLSPLSVDGIELTPGSPDYGALPSGMFAGLFAIRDSDIPTFTSQLDALAGDLVDRLSADGIDPTTLPGDAGLFYDPDGAATIDGLAARLSLNPAVDPNQGGSSWRLRDGIGATVQGPPGDSSVLSALYDALTEVRGVDSNGVQGAFSATSMAAQITSLTGQTRIQMESVQSSIQAQHRIILDAEQTDSGVDVDQQMQELLLVEQAYAANARVIQAAQEMIRQLMEI
ncbi:MAG: flagellar basal body rod C-terminal domain-containing protein, partial [Pseudomonadota bacterium]